MLSLPVAMVEAMIAHARQVYPDEACGLIGGIGTEGRMIWPIHNVADDPMVRFRMAPDEQVRALAAFEGRGWELIAIYHSHPTGPPRPSDTDIAEAQYPAAFYIIISLADLIHPAVTVWTIRDGRARSVLWQVKSD
ncbi:MAG: M67 family metallopeptidase [Anaerolineae bacterium]|nr:M67 family metallopeptidase [Anaerolineae bacterium]